MNLWSKKFEKCNLIEGVRNLRQLRMSYHETVYWQNFVEFSSKLHLKFPSRTFFETSMMLCSIARVSKENNFHYHSTTRFTIVQKPIKRSHCAHCCVSPFLSCLLFDLLWPEFCHFMNWSLKMILLLRREKFSIFFLARE